MHGGKWAGGPPGERSRVFILLPKDRQREDHLGRRRRGTESAKVKKGAGPVKVTDAFLRARGKRDGLFRDEILDADQ